MELPLGSSPSMNDHHEIETDKSAVELPLALKAIDNDGPIWMLYCSKVVDTRRLGLASQGGLSSIFTCFLLVLSKAPPIQIGRTWGV